MVVRRCRRFSFTLDEKVHRDIKSYLALYGYPARGRNSRKLSDLVNNALSEYLKNASSVRSF